MSSKWDCVIPTHADDDPEWQTVKTADGMFWDGGKHAPFLGAKRDTPLHAAPAESPLALTDLRKQAFAGLGRAASRAAASPGFLGRPSGRAMGRAAATGLGLGGAAVGAGAVASGALANQEMAGHTGGNFLSPGGGFTQQPVRDAGQRARQRRDAATYLAGERGRNEVQGAADWQAIMDDIEVKEENDQRQKFQDQLALEGRQRDMRSEMAADAAPRAQPGSRDLPGVPSFLQGFLKGDERQRVGDIQNEMVGRRSAVSNDGDVLGQEARQMTDQGIRDLGANQELLGEEVSEYIRNLGAQQQQAAEMRARRGEAGGGRSLPWSVGGRKD
jgi:hypothetical protein